MKNEIEYNEKTYKVRFRHNRTFNLTGNELHDRLKEHLESCEEITKTDLKEIMELACVKNMAPTGGQTKAFIELEDGKEIFAVADCSENDVYNKAIGRQISLGRLNKVLNLPITK